MSDQELEELIVQFDRQESTTFQKRPVQIVDIRPRHLKTQTAVFVAPGWGTTPSVYRDAILALAMTGRRVVAAATFPEVLRGISLPNLSRPHFPSIEWKKADMVIAILKAKKIECVDVVGHSESTVILSLAAYKHPPRFRNLILINPVSIAAQQTKKLLMWRAMKEFFVMRKTHATATHIRNAFWTHAQIWRANPKMHWSSISAFFKPKLPGVLRELKKRGHGISVIHGVDDKLFPVEEVAKKLNLHMIDAFYPVDGAHSDLHLDPEPVIKVVDFALDELEKKYSASSTLR